MWISDPMWEAFVDAHASEVKALREENAWLREQLGLTYAQHRQVERKEKGLPIRDAAEKKPPETIPADILELVDLYPAAARDDLMAEIQQARRATPVATTWQEIKEGIMRTLPTSLAGAR